MSLAELNTIRTFWTGPPMSLYEHISLRSFVRQGHQVEIYSYNKLPEIEGVNLCDAAEILPESEIFTYHDGVAKGGLSGFANLFRYELLYQKGGIWADLDIFCLKPLHDLPENCIGLEDKDYLNNALMRFPAGHPMLKALKEQARALGKDISFGQTGPKLLTSLLPEWRHQINVLPQQAFYPLPWYAAWEPLLGAYCTQTQQTLKGSWCFHWWNEILRRIGIDKDKLPPTDSLLYQLAKEVLPADQLRQSYTNHEIAPLIHDWLTNQLAYHPNFRQYAAVLNQHKPKAQKPSLSCSVNSKINEPSLIRVPDWLPKPLGRYYLYFTHHQGRYIRLAYADQLTGPWKHHEPGTLKLEQTACLQQNQSPLRAYIASPNVHVDHQKRQLRMYFQGHLPTGELQSFVALSEDGLNFRALPEPLGNPYFRVFEWQNSFYALSLPGQFYRSDDGLSGFKAGPCPFESRIRPAAVRIEGKKLQVIYSCIEDQPGSMLGASIDLSQDFEDWKPSPAVGLKLPQPSLKATEQPSEETGQDAVARSIDLTFDPAFFSEAGRVYIIYTATGKSGLGIRELKVI